MSEAQFEKVCKGLEHCKTEDCSGCPYEDTSAPVGKFGTDELVACQPVLYSDAISMIRQQQERIRELENRIEDLLLDLDDLRCENRQLVAERDRLESMLDM